LTHFLSDLSVTKLKIFVKLQKYGTFVNKTSSFFTHNIAAAALK